MGFISKKVYFFLTLIFFFGSSSAYCFSTVTTSSGDLVKWDPASPTFFVNTSGGPSFASTSIRGAMDNWSNVSAASLTFFNGGSTSDSGQSNNGENIVFFGDAPGSSLGFAQFFFNASGVILDCDIIIEQDNSWTESFLEDLATHEFGHCVPLGHVSDQTTMNPVVVAGVQNLAQDDIAGISFLYPGTAIPTMNEWGMIIFFISACGLAVCHLKKNNRLHYSKQ